MQRAGRHHISIFEVEFAGGSRHKIDLNLCEIVIPIFQFGFDHARPVARHGPIFHRSVVFRDDLKLALGQEGGIHDAKH